MERRPGAGSPEGSGAHGPSGRAATRADPLLVVEGLVKHFEPDRRGWKRASRERAAAVRAVDGISFTLDRGTTLALVGESGCGKSTAARTILRLMEPTGGRVVFDGEDIFALDRERLRRFRRRAQIIFQDPFGSLDPRMSVGAALREAITVHGLRTGSAVDDRVRELLAQVGLAGADAARFPHEFSGGQRQRIGIARALAVEPELIVADEPVSALDVSVQAQILNLMADLQARLGLAYLFISHDLRVVRRIADRVAVMYLGRIAELGPCETVFHEPRHPYTRALLSAVPSLRPGREGPRIRLAGEPPDPAAPPSGCPFHPRCPHPARDEQCRSVRPELEPQAPPSERPAEGGAHRAACHKTDEPW